MADRVINNIIESLKNNDNNNSVSAIHPNPCGICYKNVNDNQNAIECTKCKNWIHIKCNGTSKEEYNIIKNNNSCLTEDEIINIEWLCNKCQITIRAEIFPYGLEDTPHLLDIINTDSLKTLENLPSYEITSKAFGIDSLNKNDLDENIITNIDSHYYPVYQFKTLKHIEESFSIFHTNINGLEGKFDQFHDFVSSTEFDIDIINISETSQKENCNFDSNISIDGYRQPFSIGSKTIKGGVLTYVRENINVIERDDLNICDKSFEAVWVEIINAKAKNIVSCCLYRHPNTDIGEFIEYISKCLVKINKEKKECYLAGDFNIDLLKYDTNNKYAEFLNTMTSYGYLPHILQPTRITDFSTTVIDNIHGNSFEHESGGNILVKFADHFSQFLIINKEIVKLKANDTFRRDYSNFEDNAFIDDVSFQRIGVDDINGTDLKFDDFLWRLEACVDRHAPIKKLNKKQINKQSKPWISKQIVKMIKHRDRLFHKKKDNPLNQQIKNAYNLFRNRITREIRKEKKKYYKEFFENNLNNMKKTWQGIKEIINLNSKAGPPISQLYYEGKHIKTNEGMSNAFNNFFTNIGPNLDGEIPKCNKPGGSNFYLSNRIPHSFLISPTNPQEIKEIINNLDDSKSTGSCPIPTKLLKIAREELSIPFSDICNMSFTEGVFPHKNKIAKVIPSHKKGSTKDVNNYRPISLLSTFSKIMEKLMASRLTKYLELYEIIYPKQFGFRSGYSTSHSLISIIETVKKTMEDKKYGCGVFIDLKKAFDTVNHEILLQKLEHYGIRGVPLLWFKSYLSNRKQFVHLNGANSKTENVICGVPQGSVLGPLLFLLYINDLPNVSKKLKFYLFADDTNIYYESKSLKNLEKTMNKELEKLYEWLSINRLSLNISKTNFVIFMPPCKPKIPVTILINKEAIEESSNVKYLGILIDSRLSFKFHIDELKKKVSRSVGVLYKLRHYVTSKILTNVYYAIIYPFLAYGNVVWGNATMNLLTPLHILQKRFVRMATFNDSYPIIPGPLVHSPPLFQKLGLLTIFDIYKLQVGKLVYESVNKLGPAHTIIKFTRASEVHCHNTRYANKGNFYTNNVRTVRFGLKNLLNEGSKLWTNIPDNIKDKQSKKSFTSNLKKHLIDQYN